MGIIFLILIIWLVIALFALIAGLIGIIGLWKMFEKAGESGWKSIIPIYNVYTLCNVVGVTPYWLLFVFIATFFNAVPGIGSIVDIAACLYFSVLLCVSTAKSFGKSEDFAIGLFFLGPIFYCILGFGKAEYVGPTPMNDPVGDWILGLFGKENTPKERTTANQNNTNSNNSNNTSESEVLNEVSVNYCKNCGAKTEEGDMFCVSCGTKLN